MSTFLLIDTATSTGSVSLCRNGQLIMEKISKEQRDHAAVITPFIKEILQEAGMTGQQLDAVAISSGPGSYTGLRVATSTAKGLCYAWDIPFIAINTLEMMAYGLRKQLKRANKVLFCPMIDARRMEVFTAMYDEKIQEIMPPQAVILEEDFLQAFEQNEVWIAGTGSTKAKDITPPNSFRKYPIYHYRASDLLQPTEKAFSQKKFEDTAYFEPFYLKSVYLTKPKHR